MWLIAVDPDHIIELTIEEFHLEAIYDYLFVSGSSSGSSISKPSSSSSSSSSGSSSNSIL